MAGKTKRPDDFDQDFGFLNPAHGQSHESAESVATGVSDSGTIAECTAESSAATVAGDKDALTLSAATAQFPTEEATIKSESNASSGNRTSLIVPGYAIAITLLFLILLITGRVSLSENHTLESLPDIRPLAPNEFRRVPDGTPLPAGHALKIGESRRYGDVVVTPLKVTREPLTFQGFLSGEPAAQLTTEPILKLWLKFENAADDYGFPPFDAGLMSHRSPNDAVDDSAVVNSFLTASGAASDQSDVRVLNFLQSMDSNFVISGQESGKVIMPGEALTTFVASSEAVSELAAPAATEFTWRIHFRKGIHEDSENGITTLIDVSFSGSEIAESL